VSGVYPRPLLHEVRRKVDEDDLKERQKIKKRSRFLHTDTYEKT